MERKNLLIAGGLIGIIIVLLSIGMLMSSNSANANNSTDENSINNIPTE